VAGDHDEVTAAQVAQLGPRLALLDGDRRGFSGATASGISSIVGDTGQALRRTGKVS
jgi:hypothetical protein